MEGQGPPSTDAASLSSCSAAALRELEQRARAAFNAGREQVNRLENEITSRIESIAAALVEERAQDSSSGAWRSQLAEFEQKLADQQALWNEQRVAWGAERTSLERERDELRQKFDLALQDVQRLRLRAAELEQELARRPETGATDSAELVALRAERDALTERVESLERQPPTPADPEAEKQVADLQRRFELAVEDVRELKTKNARLESQLAAAAAAGKGTAIADTDAMDWESQKRRLLASLADGEEPLDAGRAEERSSIEGTIEMTDAIIAEKDREIAQLKALLEGGGEAEAEEERIRRISTIVDADEVIAEHRTRVAQLERETEEKLRTAELEMSLERAKLAREKAELEQWRAEWDSQRGEYGQGAAAARPGVPRRRWLSKLGLNGEES